MSLRPSEFVGVLVGRSTAHCDNISPCGISLRLRKNEIMPFEAIPVDLEVIVLSNKSDSERQM